MRSKIVTRNYAYDGDYLKWYAKYEEFLANSKLSKETCDWRLKHLRPFLEQLQQDKIQFKKLTEKDVEDCVEKCIGDLKPRTIDNRVTCFKHFLMFLKDKRVIKLSKKDIPVIVRRPLHKKKQTITK